jgi:hypothetical protein
MRRVEMSDMMYGIIREEMRREREENLRRVKLITRHEEMGFSGLSEGQKQDRLCSRERANTRASELLLRIEMFDAGEVF